MIVVLIGISMPVFWLGEVVNLLSQSRLHDSFVFSWVPPLGYVPLTESPVGWFKALLLPWLTLSVLYIGIYARVLRASLVESQEEDFVRTARAKGLTERRVMLRHSLRMSMVAFISLFGLDFGALVGGAALLTEVVFGLNGVGKLTYDVSAESRPSGDHGDGHVRRVLRRPGERDRRPRLCLARPAGPHCLRPHARRCSRCRTSASRSGPRRDSCARSTASRSRSRRAKWSGSSVSPAPARPSRCWR